MVAICGIAACDDEYGIGLNGGIPWKWEEDMRFFRVKTIGLENNAVIMGRHTYESLKGQPLRHRVNIVVSRYKNVASGFIHVSSPEEGMLVARKNSVDNLYVIGGAQLYYWFAVRRLYSKFYLSRMKGVWNCDISIADTALALSYMSNKGYDANWKFVNIFSVFEQNVDDDFKHLMSSIMRAPRLTNRTQWRTRSIYNTTIAYDLRDFTLPATTLRRQFIRGIFWELMWFLKGRTDLAFLHEHHVHIWDANCTSEAMERSRAAPGTIGRGYGYQWRNFNGSGYDQVAEIVRLLREDPTSRRIHLSGWCPPDLERAVLPPCHISYTFNVEQREGQCGLLHCCVMQRSSDVALALNWNVISAALLTHLLARTCGYEAGSLRFMIANAHIYENHEESVEIMLRRRSRGFPKIEIKRRAPIDEYNWSDIAIHNYNAHAAIEVGEMAV